MVLLLGEYLEAKDVATLRLVSRRWSSAAALLVRSMHKLSCDDVDFLHDALLVTEPHQLRRIERLDLRLYGSVESPMRPLKDGAAVPTREQRRAWVSAFVHSDVSCARLRALAVGPTVPAPWVERLLKQCTKLEALSMRGCDSVRLRNQVRPPPADCPSVCLALPSRSCLRAQVRTHSCSHALARPRRFPRASALARCGR